MEMEKHYCPDFPQSPVLPPNFTCKELYTVKAGDTLYAISQMYDVPVAILMQANRILNPYALKIGQKICIPKMDNSMSCNGTMHTVAAGDTLYGIAKKYGVTLQSVIDANPTMDPYNLRIGMQICIPKKTDTNKPGTTPTPMPTPTGPSCPACPICPPGNGGNNGNIGDGTGNDNMAVCDGTWYQVQRGDTLTRILERFGITYEELKRHNPTVDFNGSLETMRLCIPRMDDNMGCPMADTYFVKSGDNLDTISQRLLVVADSLLIANPKLTVTDFGVPGTKICIPK